MKFTIEAINPDTVEVTLEAFNTTCKQTWHRTEFGAQASAQDFSAQLEEHGICDEEILESVYDTLDCGFDITYIMNLAEMEAEV